MKRYFFRRIFIIYLAAFLLSLISIDLYVADVLRSAQPGLIKDVNAAVNDLRFKIDLAVIFTFMIFWLVIVWQTEKIRKFVGQISEYAGAIEHGLFRKKLYIKDAGEFTEIAESLNKMASDLKSSIDKNKEETNRLKVILRNIPDALMLINPEGNIELANNAAEELFRGRELRNRPFIEAVRSPAFSDLFDKVKKSLLPGEAEITLGHAAERYFSVRTSPVFFQEGKLAGILAIFHDTTELKKVDQVRKDFVANVSHEIKTPVTAISGFADALIDGALEEKETALRFVNTIKSNSDRLNRLVDDLLMLSKIELGVMKIDKRDIDISRIIGNVIETVKGSTDEKGLSINMMVHTEKITISADADRVEQILLNLAENAVKFTESGSIEIGAAADDGKGFLFVKDTGIGIPHKYIQRIGERFFRVDPSRSREMGGTGLGLSIVKHLVKAHGWEMKIESEAGKGTAVKIYYS
ncbi:MAG: ATP-binding protein [Thermodesulfovibrionia bacterium]|nr:ATP-binding protein [Thermodesulfovibrionia bacterium]